MMMILFRNLQSCDDTIYRIISLTGCFPYSFTKEVRKRSATNIFLCSKIMTSKNFLSNDSIAIHIQEYLLPTLSYV
jgi:hypothetical protein